MQKRPALDMFGCATDSQRIVTRFGENLRPVIGLARGYVS
jgi:hypothetical protein